MNICPMQKNEETFLNLVQHWQRQSYKSLIIIREEPVFLYFLFFTDVSLRYKRNAPVGGAETLFPNLHHILKY